MEITPADQSSPLKKQASSYINTGWRSIDSLVFFLRAMATKSPGLRKVRSDPSLTMSVFFFSFFVFYLGPAWLIASY